MFTAPPNSHCIADETVYPVNGPPFRWAVFVTEALPAEMIEYYAKLIGRPPDEEACRWKEPHENSLCITAIHPVEQRDKIPPNARTKIPSEARTLVFLIEKAEA